MVIDEPSAAELDLWVTQAGALLSAVAGPLGAGRRDRLPARVADLVTRAAALTEEAYWVLNDDRYALWGAQTCEVLGDGDVRVPTRADEHQAKVILPLVPGRPDRWELVPLR